MNAPSGKAAERARKNLASIFTGLSSVGQVNVAAALGISESAVSKMKEDELSKAATVIAVCGLKIVPETFKCVEPRTMETLLELAGQRMDSLRRNPEALFEDPE